MAEPVVDNIHLIRQLASILSNRAQIASAAGLSFGGLRNLFDALGYDTELTPKKYRDRYRRGDMAARIVEAYPHATWRHGAELIEDEDANVVTVFEEAWEALEKRLGIWSVFYRADVLAGLGTFSVILMGAPGKLGEPLGALQGPDDLLYLTPYGADETTIDSYEQNEEDSRYGLPLTYKISRSTALPLRSFTQSVHWTRVIHVADGLLDDRVNGLPRLERVWNRLDDLDKVVGGGSEAYWIRVHQGTTLNIDKDVKVSAAEIAKLETEASDFIHGMKRFLALRGTKLEQLGTDVSNFNAQVDSILSLISGATGIPQRILVGSERGELASTQDKENWDERVQDRRGEFAEPVVRQLVDRLIKHGILPEPVEYKVRWPEIDDSTDGERADIAVKWADLNGKAKGIVVLPEEIRDRVLKLEKLTPQQLAQAEEDAKRNAPPPPVMPGQRPDQVEEEAETTVRVEE